MSAENLDALTRLNREYLYVFVAGPGIGEGIAVALPGSGWLLVDGCTTGTDRRGLPLEAIVNRFRSGNDDPILAMVLTHPHQDHVGGFAELVEVFDPQVIACAVSEQNLLAEARQKLQARAPAKIDKIRRDSVQGAFNAIARWQEDRPRKLLLLHDGIEVSVAPSRAKVVARSPIAEDLAADLATRALGGKPVEPNYLSIVLEVTHGTGRIVLTSDLPRYSTGTTKPIHYSGWDRVMADHPQLGQHTVLKIPHHGSAEAMHPDLMPAGTVEDRAWSVTPYNRSRLPRVADMDGLPQLLAWQRSILLTSVPASKKVQAQEPPPGIVRLSQLVSRVALQPTGEPFLDTAGVEVTPSADYEPLEPVWCIAVDENANIVGRWRGKVALEVIPDVPSAS